MNRPINKMSRNGCLLRKSMLLALQKRQVLTIRNPSTTTNAIHIGESHHTVMGAPEAKCTVAAMQPAPPGIGIPTKYFFPGRPGFDGWGFSEILKRASREAPAARNRKQTIAPNCSRL